MDKMFTSSWGLISACVLLVATLASANSDDSCQISPSRSLLQTQARKNRQQEPASGLPSTDTSANYDVNGLSSQSSSSSTAASFGLSSKSSSSSNGSSVPSTDTSANYDVTGLSSKSSSNSNGSSFPSTDTSTNYDVNGLSSKNSSSSTDVIAITNPSLPGLADSTTDSMAIVEPKLADSSLRAPPEGGKFSKFFNNLSEGRGMHKWLHYFPAYQRHLKQFVGKKNVHILQIGVSSGGSLAMWKHIFGSKARIFGIDIDPQCKDFEDDQTKIFIGDQTDNVFWSDFRSEVTRIDIVIDDASQSVVQLVSALGNTLPFMSPNGVYMLESASQDLWPRSEDANWAFMHLGNVISSVHVYPYLMAIELIQNANPDAMNRQLAYNQREELSDIVMMTAEGPKTWAENGKAGSKRRAPQMMLYNADLDSAFPWLEWENQGFLNMTGDMAPVLEKVKPNSWIMVRDPNSEFSFESPWNEQADIFLNRIKTQFVGLHDGPCCQPKPNKIQDLVGSLHIYPHFLIVQMLSKYQKLAAPKHGSEWLEHESLQEKPEQESGQELFVEKEQEEQGQEEQEREQDEQQEVEWGQEQEHEQEEGHSEQEQEESDQEQDQEQEGEQEQDEEDEEDDEEDEKDKEEEDEEDKEEEDEEDKEEEDEEHKDEDEEQEEDEEHKDTEEEEQDVEQEQSQEQEEARDPEEEKKWVQ